MPEMMMDAATTSESVTTSTTPAAEPSTGADAAGQQQQPTADQNQQAPESASAESQPQGAPDQYEFQAPEGKEYDADVIATFSDAARELNLTQEAAQRFLEKMAPALEARQVQQVESLRSEWAETSKVDTEFGGAKLAENMGVAKQALEKFGTPELRSLLESSGLGNHPEVIRFFFRAGKAISEDTYVGHSPGAGSKGQPKDFAGYAAALYS